MAKYVIKAGSWIDPASGRLIATGEQVEFTDAQAQVYGLKNLTKVSEPKQEKKGRK